VPAPELRWRAYDVGGAELRAAVATVELPDLSAWRSPLDKAEILLESAAEVEHALMVQYLYAAYSLKSPDDVTDPGQQAALDDSSADSWPQTLLAIAREEMGHLMTVQNLLALLGLPPNFEREDFPPRKDLYPFALHLEALSQQSLAKYVVAEAPAGAEGIEDIVAMAQASAGAAINRVGVLYGLLGLVFSTEQQVQQGGSGSAEWDDEVRRLAAAAYQQAPAAAWHLPDDAFNPGATAQQADPADWQVGGLRVHRVSDRAAAVQAIRDVGEQGEGPTDAGALSHFQRFLGIYRGTDDLPAFPAAGAAAVTRDVPTDPQPAGFADAGARGWAELADLRYALLLGFLQHHLLSTGGDRALLVGWCFAEMRSRIGFLARRLTSMPRGDGGVAAVAFTLPAHPALPGAETARWGVHAERTRAAIAAAEAIQTADPDDDAAAAAAAANAYLTSLLASDRARLELMDAQAAPQAASTSFSRDIQPLFRPVDVEHMAGFRVDLATYDGVRGAATAILSKVRMAGPRRMPPPPDPQWTAAQVALLERWIADGFPP
jgi:hypothetical protein